jgi:hypothetical protein
MRTFRTKYLHGRPVTVPSGLAPTAPSTGACRARLKGCGMVVGDVIPMDESLESRIWEATTDRGRRRVTWGSASGWSIKPIVEPAPVVVPPAQCSCCLDHHPRVAVSHETLMTCHWCGRKDLCRDCLSREIHICKGTAKP